MTEYLDLVDYLLIAEAVTGLEAEVLAKAARSTWPNRPSPPPRPPSAVSSSTPTSSPRPPSCAPGWSGTIPSPTANKRAAWVCLREFCARNGQRLVPHSVDDAASTMEALAAGEIDEETLAVWTGERLAEA